MGRDLQPLSQRRVALACIVGVHLIGALMWTQQKYHRISVSPEIVSIFLQPAAAPASRSVSPPSAEATRRQDPVVKQSAPIPTLPKPIEGRLSNVAPSPSSDMSPATPAPHAAAGITAPQTQPGAGFDIGLARRQARGIAKEVSPGGGQVLSEASTPWTRLRRDLDAAHVAPLTGVQQESYTSPDGTIIYRKRIGNQVVCRRSGSVSSNDIGSTGGVDSAGGVSCPTNVDWKALP